MAGSCPICSGEALQTPRYPRALCADCAARATDLGGRPVELANEDMAGGFAAWHRDDGSTCEQVSGDGRVLIDGVEFHAGEARFGGTVIEPLD